MLEASKERRNLEVGTAYNHYMPERSDDWRDDELEAWKSHLVSTGKWTLNVERAWANMLHCRHEEGGLVRHVVHSGYRPLPAEVLAQMPLQVLAQGTYWRCPRLARLSHRLSCLLQSACEQGGASNIAAMHRMRDGLRDLDDVPWVASVYGNGLAFAGGLRIRLHDGRFDVLLDQLVIASGVCRDGALARLKRLAVGWACLVRMIIATSLQHAVPVFQRSLASRLQFALPAAVSHPHGNAILLTGGRVDSARVTLLGDSHDPEEWRDRLVVAGEILRACRRTQATAQAVDRAVASVAFSVTLLRPITFQLPTREEVLSRMDDLSRENIHAWAGGARVALEDPRAEEFQVWQDDIAFPQHLATFRSLGLAVDFEHANRKQVRLRLSIAIGSGVIRYPLAAAS